MNLHFTRVLTEKCDPVGTKAHLNWCLREAVESKFLIFSKVHVHIDGSSKFIFKSYSFSFKITAHQPLRKGKKNRLRSERQQLS